MSIKKQWFEVLDALYATRLDVQEIEIWQEYLRKENIRSQELIPAIEEAGEAGRKPQDWKVTVRDLITWVRIRRAKTLQGAVCEDLPAWADAYVEKWKAALQDGSGTEDQFRSDTLRLPLKKFAQFKQVAVQVLGRRIW